jgi:hypothetical protein
LWLGYSFARVSGTLSGLGWGDTYGRWPQLGMGGEKEGKGSEPSFPLVLMKYLFPLWLHLGLGAQGLGGHLG